MDHHSSTISEEFYSRLPDLTLVQVLVECGASINYQDSEGNTALHAFSCASIGLLAQPDQQDRLADLQNVLDYLLRKGAHVDARNTEGTVAGETLANSSVFKLCMMDYLSLKCLAARVIRKHSIPYIGEVPASLIPYIGLH